MIMAFKKHLARKSTTSSHYLLALTLAGGFLASGAAAQINGIQDLQHLLVQQPPLSSSESAGIVNPSNDVSATIQEKIRNNPNIFYANPGPWGRLRCAYVYLEAPKTLVDRFPLPNSKPRWTFDEKLVDGLGDLFRQAGLSEAFVNVLMDAKNVVREGNNVHLFPALPDLEAMSPAARAMIYTELAKNAGNEFHVDPVLIVGQTVDEWYRTSKLAPEIIAKVKAMSYKRGETTAFSDVSAIMNYAKSDSEARTIFKAFTRTRALLVKVELDRNTNIDELVSYWTLGLGLRRKDIEPLVQSLVDTDGVEALPLSHLMPALARKLMYTYPGLELAKHGVLPDCHWTCLNFFNYEPQEYFLDSRLATSAVLENFAPVEPPYRYGDVLFFLDNTTGDAYHSCVFLADNLVFTKNGRNLLSPWLIMRLDDVKGIYLYRGDGRVQGYRRKPADIDKGDSGN